MRNIRNNKGFTLIELMIVVVIIGILAAIAIPKFSNVGNQAKQKEADGVLKQVATLEEAYQVRFGGYTDKLAKDDAADELTDVGYQAPALKHFEGPVVVINAAKTGFTVTMKKKAGEASLVDRCLIYDAPVGGAATMSIGDAPACGVAAAAP